MNNIILIMILSISLFSQENEVIRLNKVYSNNEILKNDILLKFSKPFKIKNLTLYLNNKINLELDSSRLFSTYEIRNIVAYNQKSVDLFIYYEKSEIITLDTVIFQGNLITSDKTLLRESRLELGKKINISSLKNASKWLKYSAFTSDLNEIKWVKTNSNKYGLLFDVEESNILFINGILGVNPNKKTSNLTIDLDLKFSNISGTGRKTQIKWKKIDSANDEFLIQYGEPWLLGFPVSLNIGIGKTFRDSSYTTWKYSSEFNYPLSPSFGIGFKFSLNTTSPIDSLSASELRLPVNNTSFSSFLVTYNSFNRQVNPSKGILVEANLSTGKTENIRPSWLVNQLKYNSSRKTKLELELSNAYKVLSRGVFYSKFSLKMIEGNDLNVTDSYYLGGRNSIRGYRELEFVTNKYFLHSHELRLITGKRSRAFIFSDLAHFDKKFKYSYGMGLRFESSFGLFGVSFALPKGQGFSNGVLHFGVFSDLN